jgi:hypothetical protein
LAWIAPSAAAVFGRHCKKQHCYLLHVGIESAYHQPESDLLPHPRRVGKLFFNFVE